MAFQHYSLTLTGSAQNLASALASILPPQLSAQIITLQAAGGNAGIIYVGGQNATVSSTSYAFRIEAPVTTIPSAPIYLEDLKPGGLFLKDINVIGTNNDVLRIGIIPYL